MAGDLSKGGYLVEATHSALLTTFYLRESTATLDMERCNRARGWLAYNFIQFIQIRAIKFMIRFVGYYISRDSALSKFLYVFINLAVLKLLFRFLTWNILCVLLNISYGHSFCLTWLFLLLKPRTNGVPREVHMIFRKYTKHSFWARTEAWGLNWIYCMDVLLSTAPNRINLSANFALGENSFSWWWRACPSCKHRWPVHFQVSSTAAMVIPLILLSMRYNV